MGKKYILPGSMILMQLILLVTALLMLSCNGVSDPKFGTITGKIVLAERSADTDPSVSRESTIRIGLYQISDSDTCLTRIKTEHPNIGAMIPLEAMFDHRDQIALKIVETDVYGNYEFTMVSPGTYVLVIVTQGYSLKYIHNVNVETDIVTDLGEIALLPLVILSGYHSEQLVFSEGITYLFSDDTVVDNLAEFEKGTMLVLAPGISLRFTSQVIFQDQNTQPFRIDCSEGVFDLAQISLTSADYGGTLSFSGPDLVIKNGIIRHLNNSIGLIETNLEATNLIIQYASNGISISNGGASLQNCTFSLIPGVAFINTASGLPVSVSRSIFTSGQKALNPNTTGSITISDTYFNRLGIAVEMIMNSGSITHCAFNANDYDIKSVYSNLQVTYNDFFYSKLETIWMRANAVLAANNNFYTTDGYFTNIRGPYPTYCHVTQNVNATGSYWHPANYTDYIFDSGDDAQYPGQNCLYSVLVEPRQSRPLITAGIRD